MARTLKQLADAALEEIGFSKPSSYIGNTDETALQMVRIAQRQGDELSKESPPFNALVKEGTITLVTGTQEYSFPSDFRYIVPSTSWNQDSQRITIGPLTPSEFKHEEVWGTVSSINLQWRIRNGQLDFATDITSGENGETIVYDYVSSFWSVDGADGTTALERFQDDSDTQVFDEELFIRGLIWRFLKRKGFDWEGDFAQYERDLARVKARDGGLRDISMIPRFHLGVHIPEDGFGS